MERGGFSEVITRILALNIFSRLMKRKFNWISQKWLFCFVISKFAEEIKKEAHFIPNMDDFDFNLNRAPQMV